MPGYWDPPAAKVITVTGYWTVSVTGPGYGGGYWP